MTVIDYITKKNAILKAHTGMVLVPEELIVEVRATRLTTGDDVDSNACPYCNIHDDFDCKGCPMDSAGNNCNIPDSTWQNFVEAKGFITANYQPWAKELADLVDEFNSELDAV